MPETLWCEVCGKPVTVPHPHPTTKMTDARKLQRLAYLVANNAAHGLITASEICDRFQEVKDPLRVAYLALNIASYLPDGAEQMIRNELFSRINQAKKS